MTDLILIYTLFSTRAAAEQVVAHLLDEKLVACANIGADVTSHYDWQGKREAAGETPVFLKTLATKYAAVETRIKELHTYDVPFVGALPFTEASAAYLDWVKETLA